LYGKMKFRAELERAPPVIFFGELN
jgi:hypothetical protein